MQAQAGVSGRKRKRTLAKSETKFGERKREMRKHSKPCTIVTKDASYRDVTGCSRVKEMVRSDLGTNAGQLCFEQPNQYETVPVDITELPSTALAFFWCPARTADSSGGFARGQQRTLCHIENAKEAGHNHAPA